MATISLMSGGHQQHQKGLTLVEILVALTLGLVVIATALQIFLSSKQVYLVQEQNSGIQENGNFALEWIGKYIRMAGYRNDPTIQNNYSFQAININTCSHAVQLNDGQVIAGLDNVTNNNNSDCLIFRYHGNSDGSITNCLGTQIKNDTQTVINAFFLAFDQNINDWVLRCGSTILDNNGSVARNWNPQTFVNNVQDMQIQYYDTDTGAYVQADAVTDWTKVASVKIALLLSSDDNVSITNQNQTYIFPPWSNQSITANDFRLRRVFTTTINLRN